MCKCVEKGLLKPKCAATTFTLFFNLLIMQQVKNRNVHSSFFFICSVFFLQHSINLYLKKNLKTSSPAYTVGL